MKFLLAILFACATLNSEAQTNFVKNPSFEDTVKCPDEINEIGRSKYWTCAVDTAGDVNGLQRYAPEYYNQCAGSDLDAGVPENSGGYQYPHIGNAYIGSHLYYDKTLPFPSGLSANWRDYAQGHLITTLENGKTYCVSFWVVMAEVSAYAHDNIGVYLDNGNINKRSPAGEMITDVTPQVYSTSIIKDTMNWVKVEGTFVANGTETHITLGNFAKQADVDTDFIYWGGLIQYSYYLIDDVSVVAIDAKANAGADRWVELGKSTQIGPVEDSTARGMDCKWYHKGKLIDSGNVISVNASTIKYAVDTYVVVQNVCGNITRDTMLLRTVGLGLSPALSNGEGVSVSPNPSSGKFVITCHPSVGGGGLKVYDLLGRVVHQEQLNFSNKEATLKLNIPTGSYILELKDGEGNVQRERLIIE